jgi:hypothetical protein
MGNETVLKFLRVFLNLTLEGLVLGTLFSQMIFIFPREISSFSLGKIGIPWENDVPKLALRKIKIS